MLKFIESRNLAELSGNETQGFTKLYCKIWKEKPWKEYFWTDDIVIAQIKEDAKRQGFRFIIALDEAKDNISVIGFAIGFQASAEEMLAISSGTFKQSCFYVSDIAVAIEHRKKHIGSKLLYLLAGDIKENICMRTDTNSRANIIFYTENGFSNTEIKDGKHLNRTYWIRQPKPSEQERARWAYVWHIHGERGH